MTTEPDGSLVSPRHGDESAAAVDDDIVQEWQTEDKTEPIKLVQTSTTPEEAKTHGLQCYLSSALNLTCVLVHVHVLSFLSHTPALVFFYVFMLTDPCLHL